MAILSGSQSQLHAEIVTRDATTRPQTRYTTSLIRIRSIVLLLPYSEHLDYPIHACRTLMHAFFHQKSVFTLTPNPKTCVFVRTLPLISGARSQKDSLYVVWNRNLKNGAGRLTTLKIACATLDCHNAEVYSYQTPSRHNSRSSLPESPLYANTLRPQPTQPILAP
jgi:hypothetical protein